MLFKWYNPFESGKLNFPRWKLAKQNLESYQSNAIVNLKEEVIFKYWCILINISINIVNIVRLFHISIINIIYNIYTYC